MNTIPATPDQTARGKLYPAFLSLQGKVCVVVGGGAVSARKVRSLLATKAQIIVISPILQSELQVLLSDSLIRHIPYTYAAEFLAGATIVFAATNDPEVNRQIVQDAHQQGCLVNVADDPEASDFFVPATIHRQNLTIAVSTVGESPAFC